MRNTRYDMENIFFENNDTEVDLYIKSKTFLWLANPRLRRGSHVLLHALFSVLLICLISVDSGAVFVRIIESSLKYRSSLTLIEKKYVIVQFYIIKTT